jgi:hypothetical protein
MIMWILIFIVPFVSILVLGYLVIEAPEVSNDFVEY